MARIILSTRRAGKTTAFRQWKNEHPEEYRAWQERVKQAHIEASEKRLERERVDAGKTWLEKRFAEKYSNSQWEYHRWIENGDK